MIVIAIKDVLLSNPFNIKLNLILPKPSKATKQPEEETRDSNLPNNQLIQSTVGSNVRKELPAVTLENGAVYIGEWKNGQRDGKGTQIWPDGSKYEGDWVRII